MNNGLDICILLRKVNSLWSVESDLSVCDFSRRWLHIRRQAGSASSVRVNTVYRIELQLVAGTERNCKFNVREHLA